MKKALIIFFTISVLLIILIIFVSFNYKDNKLHVVFCDVGQGDAMLIITPTQAQILVDGGPDKKVLDCLGRHMPFWDRTLDAVILTHPHADHLTGLIHVIERYHVNRFYTEDIKADSDVYKLLEAKLADHALSAKDLNVGDKMNDKSGSVLEILWPRLNENTRVDHNIADLDLNGLSVVASLSYGNFSMLFTGDAGKIVMDEIGAKAGDVDILKVPHHGSSTGMSELFLNLVSPEVVVISVGKENKYGHPARKSLDLLRNRKVNILRTDEDGEVEIISDGKIYKIKSSL